MLRPALGRAGLPSATCHAVHHDHALRHVRRPARSASRRASLALPAEAQWKWKDKNGHIQYSDLPPPTGTPEKDILMQPSARHSSAPAAATSAPAAVRRGRGDRRRAAPTPRSKPSARRPRTKPPPRQGRAGEARQGPGRELRSRASSSWRRSKAASAWRRPMPRPASASSWTTSSAPTRPRATQRRDRDRLQVGLAFSGALAPACAAARSARARLIRIDQRAAGRSRPGHRRAAGLEGARAAPDADRLDAEIELGKALEQAAGADRIDRRGARRQLERHLGGNAVLRAAGDGDVQRRARRRPASAVRRPARRASRTSRRRCWRSGRTPD